MIAGLTPYGKRYYGYLLRGYDKNYRPSSMYNVVRKYEPNYRWGQFRYDWGVTGRAYRRAQRIRYTIRPKIPSEASYIPSPSVLISNYYTVMKVHVWDKMLEDYDDIFVTVGHDIRLPRYELEEYTRINLIDPSERYEYQYSAPDIGFKKG